MTEVIHKNKSKSGDVYIGRPSIFGNPYSHQDSEIAEFKVSSRTEAIARFKTYFDERLDSDLEFRKQVRALKGKRLVCWCSPLRCHGDIIAKYVDSLSD